METRDTRLHGENAHGMQDFMGKTPMEQGIQDFMGKTPMEQETSWGKRPWKYKKSKTSWGKRPWQDPCKTCMTEVA